MIKFPFSEAGVHDLFSTLYYLPDELLTIEVIAMEHDFKRWVDAHFLLEPAQLQYLNNLPDSFTEEAARLTATAMSNRLQIILNKPAQSDATIRKGKLISTQNTLDTSFSETDGKITTGEVIFTISY
ncbi:MAG TPA: hypothetical protein VN040_14685 [Pseudosphingobacterium sp.]|nr:hypothetical protein [Pseudosphingobacterium sp.]